MADQQPTFRLDLTWSELEAIAWAVWFAAPSAMTMHVSDLDAAEKKLLAKRRDARKPRAVQERGDQDRFGGPGGDQS